MNKRIEFDKSLWTLLRKDDWCIVRSSGVQQKGIVKSIINLSCGKTLLVVMDTFGNSLGLFNSWEVSPVDAAMINGRITSYEAMLRCYEPKGMSTATSQIY